jgi:hypothetical protein
MMRFLYVLLATVALMSTTFAATKAPITKAVTGAKGGGSGQTDAQIERTIREKLAKSKIGADKFQVHVQGGVATWEGKTDVIQHKGSATRMAKTAGATTVKNNIQVSDAARAKAANNLESGRRRAQLKRGDSRSDAKTAR